MEKAKDPEDRCREILKFINERTKSDSLLNPNESNPFLVRNRVRRKSASTNHSSRRPHRKSNSNSLVNTPKRTRIPPTLGKYKVIFWHFISYCVLQQTNKQQQKKTQRDQSSFNFIEFLLLLQSLVFFFFLFLCFFLFWLAVF